MTTVYLFFFVIGRVFTRLESEGELGAKIPRSYHYPELTKTVQIYEVFAALLCCSVADEVSRKGYSLRGPMRTK